LSPSVAHILISLAVFISFLLAFNIRHQPGKTLRSRVLDVLCLVFNIVLFRLESPESRVWPLFGTTILQYATSISLSALRVWRPSSRILAITNRLRDEFKTLWPIVASAPTFLSLAHAYVDCANKRNTVNILNLTLNVVSCCLLLAHTIDNDKSKSSLGAWSSGKILREEAGQWSAKKPSWHIP
jgi:hypothetical protein